MKKYKTISFSLPESVAAQVDKISEEMNISRSALLTAMLSTLFKWSEQATVQEKKDLLNSVYGKKG